MSTSIGGLVGVAILVGLWEILALTVFNSVGSGVPDPDFGRDAVLLGLDAPACTAATSGRR